MEVTVSIGEAMDKYSILQLKNEMIEDPERLHHVQNEIDLLHPKLATLLQRHPFLFGLLLRINRDIWHMINRWRALPTTDPSFIQGCVDINSYNDARFRIKSKIDRICNSLLKEQKSYGATSFVFPSLPTTDDYERLAPCIHHAAVFFDQVIVHYNHAILPDLPSSYFFSKELGLQFESSTTVSVPPTSFIYSPSAASLPEEFSLF